VAKRPARLLVTERALRDLAELRAYSIQHWGKRVAAKYIADLEAALTRLREHPDLVREHPELHPELRFYRVNQHYLVCDTQPRLIYVLTIIHASRDVPSCLHELEPTLAEEVAVLHDRLSRGTRRKK